MTQVNIIFSEEDSLGINSHNNDPLVDSLPSEVPIVDFEVWNPILDVGEERLTPIKDLKEVHIGPHVHQVTKIFIS